MLDLIKTTRKWFIFYFIRNIWQKLFIFDYLLENRKKEQKKKHNYMPLDVLFFYIIKKKS